MITIMIMMMMPRVSSLTPPLASTYAYTYPTGLNAQSLFCLTPTALALTHVKPSPSLRCRMWEL